MDYAAAARPHAPATAAASQAAPLRISQIVHGKRAITADTALRLARYFGTTPGIWLRLQARYDLEVAQEKVGKTIRREVKELRRPAAAP